MCSKSPASACAFRLYCWLVICLGIQAGVNKTRIKISYKCHNLHRGAECLGQQYMFSLDIGEKIKQFMFLFVITPLLSD
jgi:hypothetical protein